MKIGKRILFVIAMVILIGIVGASSASAQINCNANSQPSLVRSTGLTEVMGPIVLSCTASAIAPASSMTVSIQPASAIITNNPTGATASPVCVSSPTPLGNFVPTIIFSQGSIALGSSNNVVCTGVVSGNTVTFPTPSTIAAGTFTMTIGAQSGFSTSVGIRANVSASGVSFPGQISALITSAIGGPVSINNNSVNIAIPQQALAATTFGAAPGIAQCGSTNVTGGLPTAMFLGAAVTNTSTASTLSSSFGITVVRPSDNSVRVPNGVQIATITEAFPSAWSVAGANGGSLGEGSDSTQGTRIQLDLTNFPANVIIVAPNYVQSSSVITPGATTQFALVTGAFSPPVLTNLSAGNNFGGLTLVNGSSLTYEATSSIASVAEAINIPLAFFTTGTPSTSGIVTAAIGLAPVSNIGTAVASPIPRFTASTTAGSVLNIIPCLSNILFPYIYNTAGFDSGISIANTTSDVFATAAQSGTCVYNFFGNNAPAGGTFTSPSIPGGQVDTQLLSVIAPGFSGYVIAQCNFQLGHGYAVIFNGYPGGVVTTSYVVDGRIILQPANLSTTSATGRRGLASAGPASFGETLGE